MDLQSLRDRLSNPAFFQSPVSRMYQGLYPAEGQPADEAVGNIGAGETVEQMYQGVNTEPLQRARQVEDAELQAAVTHETPVNLAQVYEGMGLKEDWNINEDGSINYEAQQQQDEVTHFVGNFVDEQGHAATTAPIAARIFASTVLGTRAEVTERDLNQQELDLLYDAAMRATVRGRNYLQYGDYGENEDWLKFGNTGFVTALTDPGASMAYTLGKARFSWDENGGLTIEDSYDFAGSRQEVNDFIDRHGLIGAFFEAYKQHGLLSLAFFVANMAVPQDEGGRPVTIKIAPRS